MTDKISLKYIGVGFVVGIPARDMTAKDVEIYGKKLLLESGLYIEPKKQAKKDGK